MRDLAHQIVYSAICSFFWVLQIVYNQDARTILTQNTSKDAVPRKDVPFGVAKPKFKLYTPFCRKNRHFGAPLRRDLEIFARKRL